MSSRSEPCVELRVRELAASFDCIVEEDFRLFAGITRGTAETWRRTGRGPSYILCGNQYLYPRSAVADFLASQLRSLVRPSAKGQL
jgi:hypothetical protein